MDNFIWIPAFVFLLGVLVFFHEFGHFTVAKLLKIRVDEFAFGFGPKWIRLFKRGETEYTIHPVPLGGFVKLAGENPEEPAVPGGFTSKPWYQRWLVYFAGPFASFLLAYIIFCTMGVTVGLPITGNAENRVDMVIPGSRAEKAGLQIGDKIVALNGHRISNGNQLVEYVHNSINKPLTLEIERGGQKLIIHATPEAKVIDGKRVGLLGFAPAQQLTRVGMKDSVMYGTTVTVAFVDAIAHVIFSKDIAKNVGGPISIADETSKSVKRGASGFLELIAMLSLSLGVFNLMPIPVVDGGQMVLAVAEGIKGRRLSTKTVEIAQFIGIAAIALIFVAIMYLDLHRLLTGQIFP